MSKLWRYKRDDRECGPVTSADLKSLADAGRLAPTDRVCRAGTDRWVRAALIRGLFDNKDRPGFIRRALSGQTALVAAGLAILVLVVAVPVVALAHRGPDSNVTTTDAAPAAVVRPQASDPPPPAVGPRHASGSRCAAVVRRPVHFAAPLPPVEPHACAASSPAVVPAAHCAPPPEVPPSRGLLGALREMRQGRAELDWVGYDIGGHRSAATSALDLVIGRTENALHTAGVDIKCEPADGCRNRPTDLRHALRDIREARHDLENAGQNLGCERDWALRQLSLAANEVQLAMAVPEPACHSAIPQGDHCSPRRPFPGRPACP
jgi:hypothetical protein